MVRTTNKYQQPFCHSLSSVSVKRAPRLKMLTMDVKFQCGFTVVRDRFGRVATCAGVGSAAASGSRAGGTGESGCAAVSGSGNAGQGEEAETEHTFFSR